MNYVVHYSIQKFKFKPNCNAEMTKGTIANYVDNFAAGDRCNFKHADTTVMLMIENTTTW